MGVCARSAYNLDQVKKITDLDYIIECDVEFYQEMLKSAKNDKLEKSEEKKQQKIAFIQLVIDGLTKLNENISNFDGKKKFTDEEIATVKQSYQNAINVINLLDKDKFNEYIQLINNMIKNN